jgi:hypothetical protein
MEQVFSLPLIIVAVRLIAPLALLRWPLAGIVISTIADTFDHPVAQHFGWGLYGNGHYQYVDKVLDTWYLCFIFMIVRRWSDVRARRAATWLFFWRLAGVTFFEATGWEKALVFAPNIFEHFATFWLIALKWFPSFRLTARRLAITLLAIGIPKIILELSMHWLYPGVAIRNVILHHLITSFSTH